MVASPPFAREIPPGTNPGELPIVTTGPTLNKGVRTIVGVITAGQLFQRYLIPRRDHFRRTGYQRDVSQARVNRLMTDLTNKRVDLPTAILLNLREFDPLVHLRELSNGLWELVIDGLIFYVVDGQHRIEALRRLMEIDPVRWSGFQIPFVCMLGAPERVEMEQFYVVNSTAKSVRTDLALDLLRQRAESDPEIMNSLVERGESWKVLAQNVVEELERSSPEWHGRVRFAGEPAGASIAGSSMMVSSLRPLLNSPFFGSLSSERQLRVLDAYWRGIKSVLPEVFAEPAAFALQKGPGVPAMHSLLIYVLEALRSKGDSVLDPEAYANVLRPTLEGLEGDTAEGEVVSGADFWRSGAGGAAGSFSSNAGRRVLVAKLRSRLPEVELEQ